MSRSKILAVVGVITIFAPAMSALAEVPPSEAYQLHCSGCHGPTGEGRPGSVPSLIGLDRLLSVPDGRNYLIRVPGVAQAPLPSDELAALLNWILGELNGAIGFTPFESEEVERLRKTPFRDPASERPLPARGADLTNAAAAVRESARFMHHRE